MYDIGDAGGLYASMPSNMQDEKTDAFCFAVERQAGRIRNLLQKLNVWSDLDHVKPGHYDYVAACLRALYYRSDLPDHQKLAAIKSAMMTYRYAGSMRAIEELLNNVFSEAEFIPWYEYGGKPFCFKVKTNETLTENNTSYFLNMINKVKSARDKVEIIEVTRITHRPIHSGTGGITHSKCVILDHFNEKRSTHVRQGVGMEAQRIQRSAIVAEDLSSQVDTKNR